MIKLTTHKSIGVSKAYGGFVLKADQPIFISVVHPKEVDVSAYVYKLEDSEGVNPLGEYNSYAPEDWNLLNIDEAPDTRQWRLFMNNDEIGDVDFLDEADAKTRTFQDEFTHYHSLADEALLIESIMEFDKHDRNYSLRQALDRIIEIKMKLSK